MERGAEVTAVRSRGTAGDTQSQHRGLAACHFLIREQHKNASFSFFSYMDYDIFFTNSCPHCCHHSGSSARHWNVRRSFSRKRLNSTDS